MPATILLPDNAAIPPRKIGGWLILIAIGVIGSPLAIASSLVTDFLPFLTDETWNALTTPGEVLYHPLWSTVLLYELIGNIVSLAFNLYIAYLFFGKKKSFPKLFILSLGLHFVFLVGDLFLVSLIPMVAAENDTETLSSILRLVAGSLIWIPYMLRSVRVRQTFTLP